MEQRMLIVVFQIYFKLNVYVFNETEMAKKEKYFIAY